MCIFTISGFYKGALPEKVNEKMQHFETFSEHCKMSRNLKKSLGKKKIAKRGATQFSAVTEEQNLNPGM